VQESIYESCLVSTRKTVHKNIARHLELSKADQLPKFYGQIGNHYFAADEWRSASLYLQLSAEVSEKNDMPKTVITELLRWFGIREKLGLSDGDPGVNGRYSTAKMEEGVVCAMMARAYEKLMKYVPSKKSQPKLAPQLTPNECRFDNADKYASRAMKKLGNSFPVTRVLQVKMVLKGFAWMNFMAFTGRAKSYDVEPSAHKEAYFDAIRLMASTKLKCA
jgi:hypothetical protein